MGSGVGRGSPLPKGSLEKNKEGMWEAMRGHTLESVLREGMGDLRSSWAGDTSHTHRQPWMRLYGA